MGPSDEAAAFPVRGRLPFLGGRGGTGGKFGVQVTSKEIGTPFPDDPTDFNNLVSVSQYTDHASGKVAGPVDQAKRFFMIEFDDTSNHAVVPLRAQSARFPTRVKEYRE